MKNAAIFGCGAAGKRACLQLKSKYRIVTFLDNNRRERGSRLFGVPVQDPESYDYRQVDHVFIASVYLDEILVQLLALGVPPSKIEDMAGETLVQESPNWPAFNALRRALYVPFRFLR
jgi:FlaA1/EpsC-like NDP-sugar epimerase